MWRWGRPAVRLRPAHGAAPSVARRWRLWLHPRQSTLALLGQREFPYTQSEAGSPVTLVWESLAHTPGVLS